MYRGISRVLGRTCRKWREECPPIVSGEEVRGHKKEEKFIPETKYTFNDALGWTAGLILAYEFTHGRKRFLGIQEQPRNCFFGGFSSSSGRDGESSSSSYNYGSSRRCPFGWPKSAITQPILSQSVLEVNNSTIPAIKAPPPSPSSTSVPRTHSSIDLTPFLKEEDLLFDQIEERYSYSSSKLVEDDDDDLIQFKKSGSQSSTKNYSNSANSTVLRTKKTVDPESYEVSHNYNPTLVERFTGDLFSILGAFKFLNHEAKGLKPTDAMSHIDYKNNVTPEEPPMTAMELMERGAELGSARAFYNIGVAYDRMKEYKLAKEYYCKASDLGHPLASYNCAIFLLKEGKFGDGLSMMQFAANSGVPEAKKIVSSCSSQTK